MDRMEEALAKLALNHLHVTKKLDDLLVRVAALESNFHHSPSPSHPQSFLHQTHNHLIILE